MVCMKPRLFALFLCASLISAVQANAKTILPDACGDDGVKFDVNAERNQMSSPLSAPEHQALLVFSGKGQAVIRYGMDGVWVGANKGDSYFTVSANPGIHHLCAGWQSISGKLEKNIGVLSFTAESGKVYYFEAEAGESGGGGGYVAPGAGRGMAGGGGFVGGSKRNYFFELKQLDEDTGKYRVKAWKLATSKPK